jgi:hypothetical protein
MKRGRESDGEMSGIFFFFLKKCFFFKEEILKKVSQIQGIVSI